jgi:hypothetical protein
VTSQRRYTLLGRTVQLTVEEPSAFAEFERHLPDEAHRTSNRPDRWFEVRTGPDGERNVWIDGTPRPVRLVDSELPGRFGHLVRADLARNSPSLVFVHAGCVVINGRAVVIPGRSLAGKTSLTLELLRRGGTYFSDEYAVLDPNGMVHPFLKPVGFRPDGSTAPGQPTPVHNLVPAALAGGGPVQIGAVVAATFAAGVQLDDPWQKMVPITPGRASLVLLGNAVAAKARFREVTEVIGRALVHCPIAWAGTRGDAATFADSLLDRLASDPWT